MVVGYDFCFNFLFFILVYLFICIFNSLFYFFDKIILRVEKTAIFFFENHAQERKRQHYFESQKLLLINFVKIIVLSIFIQLGHSCLEC